jgi:hypothetical protein
VGLFIPTSGAARPSYQDVHLTKGQLYNLDRDEFLTFQFNPATFAWERDTRWAEITFKGDDTGGDLQYLNTGPRTFDLPLLYIADPGAPEVIYQAAQNDMFGHTVADFEFLQKLIESWEAALTDKRRPSRIKVILGQKRSFECVIKNSEYQLIEFFDDLTVREGLITLEMREWRLE